MRGDGKVPGMVGVPVTSPVAARCKPSGSAPEADHVNGAVPPLDGQSSRDNSRRRRLVECHVDLQHLQRLEQEHCQPNTDFPGPRRLRLAVAASIYRPRWDACPVLHRSLIVLSGVATPAGTCEREA